MPTHDTIKQFVRHTLGCTCPDDVFESIQSTQLPEAILRLDIGGRLLVHIAPMVGDRLSPSVINDLVEKGVKDRNAQGFNRFRLVLASDQAQSIEVMASQAFQHCALRDERTHLHVIDRSSIPLMAENPDAIVE